MIALGALIGSELIVSLYLISLFIMQLHTMKSASNSMVSGKHARQKLLEVSLPTTILRIFHAITNAIQPFLIQSALIKSGFVAVMATEHFGMLTGVAMTIGFFPAFIAHSLMIMLIPNVADAYAKNDYAKTKKSFTINYVIYDDLWSSSSPCYVYICRTVNLTLFFFLGSSPLLETIVALFPVSLLRDTDASLSNRVRIS